MYRNKYRVYIGFSTIHGFRHPLGVLKHILQEWGGGLLYDICCISSRLLNLRVYLSQFEPSDETTLISLVTISEGEDPDQLFPSSDTQKL